MDERTDGRMDERTDGRMEEQRWKQVESVNSGKGGTMMCANPTPLSPHHKVHTIKPTPGINYPSVTALATHSPPPLPHPRARRPNPSCPKCGPRTCSWSPGNRPSPPPRLLPRHRSPHTH
eukprot:239321-Chlamydomonas_euryale.AAC.2